MFVHLGQNIIDVHRRVIALNVVPFASAAASLASTFPRASLLSCLALSIGVNFPETILETGVANVCLLVPSTLRLSRAPSRQVRPETRALFRKENVQSRFRSARWNAQDLAASLSVVFRSWKKRSTRCTLKPRHFQQPELHLSACESVA